MHKKTSNWKQPIFGDATTGFPAKWRLRNEHRNSILMTRHYPNLGSASDWSCRVGNLIQPIRSNTPIWVVTRHQYDCLNQISHAARPIRSTHYTKVLSSHTSIIATLYGMAWSNSLVRNFKNFKIVLSELQGLKKRLISCTSALIISPQLISVICLRQEHRITIFATRRKN